MKMHINAVAIVVMGTIFMGTYSQHSHSENAPNKDATVSEEQRDFKNLDDRYSYAYGVKLAQSFKNEGIELNVSLLAEGMQAVFDGSELKMPIDEVIETANLYEAIHQKKKEAERAKLGKKNKKEGKKFLAQNANKDGVVVTESGLQYKVITQGNGGYKATVDDVVTVNYRAGFVDGSEFDSTYQRDEPFSGKVGKLIPGWAEAVQMMAEGSKWELYIPADLAYGEDGSGDFVGPNATLVFEVELLEIEKE